MKSLKENIEECMTCPGECSGCSCPYFPALVLTGIFFLASLYDILKNAPVDEKGASILLLILFTFVVFVAFIITMMLIKGFWKTLKQALEELKCSK